jgi:hypothetical protein
MGARYNRGGSTIVRVGEQLNSHSCVLIIREKPTCLRDPRMTSALGSSAAGCAAKSGSHPLLFRFRKQKMPGPMAIRVRSNGTSCGVSDVKRLAHGN